MDIRDRRLYRKAFKTFEDYCRKRWEMARSTAYQRIRAAETLRNLSAMADILPPTTERQIRALNGLQPGQQKQVWIESVKAASGGKVTGHQVRAIRARLGFGPAVGSKKLQKTVSVPLTSAESRWGELQALLEEEFRRWPEQDRPTLIQRLQAQLEEWKAR